MNRIVIAIDGSPAASVAARFGIELAFEHDAYTVFVLVAPEVDVVPTGGFGLIAHLPHELSALDRKPLGRRARAGCRGRGRREGRAPARRSGRRDRRLCRFVRGRSDRRRLPRPRCARERAARQRLPLDPERDAAAGAGRARRRRADRGSRGACLPVRETRSRNRARHRWHGGRSRGHWARKVETVRSLGRDGRRRR
jgi:hypothetical protein